MMDSDIILSALREQEEVLYSWGSSNYVSLDNGLQFSVQGFLFTGMVTILHMKDSESFAIRLDNPDGSFQTERAGIAIDDLIATVDSLVENNSSQDDYKKRVIEQYEGKQTVTS